MNCRRAVGLILILTLIVLPVRSSADSSLEEQIETLARRVRIHNYDTYRLQRSELDRRQQILFRAIEAWRERGSSDAEAAELLAWLETALDVSQSGFDGYSPRQRSVTPSSAVPALEAHPAPVAPRRSPADVRQLVPAVPLNRGRTAATVPLSPVQPPRRPAATTERTEPDPFLVTPPPPRPERNRHGYNAPSPVAPQVVTEPENAPARPTSAEPAPQVTTWPKVWPQPQPSVEPLEVVDDAAPPPARALPNSAVRPPRREFPPAPPRVSIAAPAAQSNGAPLGIVGQALPPSVPNSADTARPHELPSAPTRVTDNTSAAQTDTDSIRINLTVLSTKVQAFNQDLNDLEGQLSLDEAWDLLRLQTVAEDFAALDSARNHLLLFLETLSPMDRHKLPQLADPAVALARFTQRMFEVRVQYSEKSRQGDHSLPLEWEVHMDRIQSNVRNWMVENRD